MLIFARPDIEIVNGWISQDQPSTFFHLTRFESDERRKAVLAVFGADAALTTAKAARETSVPLLECQARLLPNSTNFAPADAGR